MATTRAPRSNLEIVFADWLDAMRRGDLACMSGRLAPDVVHQGVKDEWVCNGRDEVLRSVGRRVGKTPAVEAIELVAAGDHVVMSVRAPEVGVPLEEGQPARGGACVVFTLRDGLIVHMHDHLSRAEALQSVGASVDWQ